MNGLFLALLVGVALYLVWQWDRDSRRRRAALKSGAARAGARPPPAKVSLSTWLARIAVAAIAAWAVFLVLTLFRSAT
jgi:hypothetical protein